jgi:hypothetical protein
MRRVFHSMSARLYNCCAHHQRFLTKNRLSIPINRSQPAQTGRSLRPALPSRGGGLRPIGFSHRRRDGKSLVYLSIILAINISLFAVRMAR